MAPITWRDVAAPNFSDAAASQRAAGVLMSSGFDNAISALSGFGTSQKKDATDASSSEFLARIQGYNDPKQLNSALFNGTIFDGLNRASISPEALQWADSHRQNLLKDTQTGVQTAGFQLNNNNQSLVNDQLKFTNDKTRSFEAARPAAVDLVNQIRTTSQLGTPEAIEKARQLQAGGSSVFAAAGWTPEQINSEVTGNATAAGDGIDLNTALRGQGDAIKAHDQEIEAQKLYTSVLPGVGNDTTEAERVLREERPDVDPTVKALALAKLETPEAKSLATPDVDPASFLLKQAIRNPEGAPATTPSLAGKTIDHLAMDASNVKSDAAASGVSANADASALFDSAVKSSKALSDKQNQALFDGTTDLTSQAASVSDALQVDGLFGPSAMASTLLDPAVSGENQAASIARVKAALGGGLDIKDDEIANNINTVMDRYGMTSGQAGTVLENAINQNIWGTRWLLGNVDFDLGKVDKLVSTVYDKNGTTRGEKYKPAMELLQTARSKQVAAENLGTAQQKVQEAQQRYFTLLDRSKSNPGLDGAVQEAQLKYQALLGQMQKTIKSIDTNPLVGFNSAAK